MNLEISGNLSLPLEKYEEAEDRTDVFFQNTFNDHSYRKLIESLDNLDEAVDRASPENELDRLILRDLEYNKDATKEYAGFIRRDSDLSVEEMFNLLYGENSFDKLKDEAHQYDEEAEYEAHMLQKDLVRDNPWKYEDEIQSIAFKISNEIEEWSRENGLMPDDFRFEIHTIPQGTNQRANWRGQLNQMNIPIESFDVIRGNGDGIMEKGSYIIEPTRAIFTIFHELVGHGVHQNNSEILEYPQFTEKTTYRPSSMAHCEGVSQHRESLGKQFIHDNKEELPVMDIGLTLRDLYKENADQREIYSRFVSEMEARDEIDEEKAEDLVGEVYNPDYSDIALNSARNNLGLIEAFSESCYLAGNKLMDDINASERSTFAITTGQWSAELLPEAVEFLSKKR